MNPDSQKIGLAELEKVAASDCTSAHLRNALRKYAGFTQEELYGTRDNARHNSTTFTEVRRKKVMNAMDVLEASFALKGESSVFKRMAVLHWEKYDGETQAYQKNVYIKPITLEELTEIANSDASFYTLLDAMRRYSHLQVKDLVQSAPTTPDYFAYFRFRTPSAYTTANSARVKLYADRMREAVSNDTKLDSDKFNELVMVLYRKYADTYLEYNKDDVKVSRSTVKAASEREGQHRKRIRKAENVDLAETFQGTLKALRLYYGLTREDIGTIMSPKKPLTREAVRHFELTHEEIEEKSGKEKRYYLPPKKEHMLNLVKYYYQAKRPDDEPEDKCALRKNLIKLKNLWVHECANKRSNTGGRLLNIAGTAESEEYYPYLAYLVTQAGYKNYEFEARSGENILSMSATDKPPAFAAARRIERALESRIPSGTTHSRGRNIKQREIAKLQMLYHKFCEQEHTRSMAATEEMSDFAGNNKLWADLQVAISYDGLPQR